MKTLFFEALQWQHLAIFTSYCIVAGVLLNHVYKWHNQRIVKKFVLDGLTKARAKREAQETKAETEKTPKYVNAWEQILEDVNYHVRQSLDPDKQNISKDFLNKCLVNYTADTITLNRAVHDENKVISPVEMATLCWLFQYHVKDKVNGQLIVKYTSHE